jgi:hypothetical protein
MYKGTLIEELFATVERVESHVASRNEDLELERWFAKLHPAAPRTDENLVGVA